MKARGLSLLLVFIVLTLSAGFHAPVMRIPWVVTALICFGGVLIFDTGNRVVKNWVNVLLFLGIYGLSLQGLLETTPEGFWRDLAGSALLVSFLFEQNSLPWSGRGFLRSTVPSAIIIFVLVLVQSIPFLSAEISLACAIAALLIFSFMEFFSILRENSDMNSGSCMAALRASSCGLGILFYTSVFLPNITRQPPFIFLQVGLPILGVLVAVFSLFLSQWRRRHILFFCNWSIFIFWAALTGESYRFTAAVGALIAGVWTIMMNDKTDAHPSDIRDLYLKLASWGIPGSFLFSMVVFMIFPSEAPLVKQGAAIWLFTFFVYWSGLRRFDFSNINQPPTNWSWRQSLALAVTIAGAGLLAGARVLPKFISDIWGLAR